MTLSHPLPASCQWFSRLAAALDRHSAPRLALMFLGVVLAWADLWLGRNDWWLVDLAYKLQVNSLKLRDWICRGWVRARQTPVQGYWIACADDEELGRPRELGARSYRGRTGYPSELTTSQRSV